MRRGAARGVEGPGRGSKRLVVGGGRCFFSREAETPRRARARETQSTFPDRTVFFTFESESTFVKKNRRRPLPLAVIGPLIIHHQSRSASLMCSAAPSGPACPEPRAEPPSPPAGAAEDAAEDPAGTELSRPAASTRAPPDANVR